MSDLPAGWTETTLGEISSQGQYGWTSKAAEKGRVKYLRTTDITSGHLNWDTVPYCQDNPPNVEKYKIEPGDILISRAGSVGFSALIEDVPSTPAVFASYLIRYIPNSQVNPKFIARFLQSPNYWQQISDASAGIALANVNAKKLANVILPLPPLNEQKRIAEKLDTLLARVDSCQTHLERVPQILKRFRQSVLAAATSGRLTEDWREKQGRDLSDWTETTVGNLIDDIEAGINYKCEERPPLSHERGLVKISAVTWSEFNDEESKTLPTNRDVPKSTRIKVGDFLISRANTIELVAACVIVKQVNRPVYLSDKVLRIVMRDEIKLWLLYWLRSSYGRSQIESLASGNQLSMRNISQANLKLIQVNLPKQDEIDEIVRRVEKLFTYAAKLETRYTSASEHVERLTPSLLAKAFRGELVGQDAGDEFRNKVGD